MNNCVEAVFLGIDVAKKCSGAVILTPDYGPDGDQPFSGRYALGDTGEVKNQDERIEWVEKLLQEADTFGLVPVVVAETWDPPLTRKVRTPDGSFWIAMDQKWTFDTILGMGEGWGMWMAEILAADVPVIHRVTPNVWRDALFGTRREKSTEACKVLAKRAFEGLFGFSASADIAEGAMLAIYGATHSEDVAKAVEAELRREELNKPPPKKPKVTQAKGKKKAAKKAKDKR